MGEEDYARGAGQAHEIGASATIAWEYEEAEEARRLENLLDSRREFAWVGRWVMGFVFPGDPADLPDIDAPARRRYRERRRQEAIFLTSAIGLLVVGKGAALGGLLDGGTSRCSPYLWIATMSVVGSLLAITLGGARELVESLRH